MSFPKYVPSSLATLPSTLDPAEYDISPETRKAQAERLAIRSRLKREYLLKYNDPNRRGLIVSGGLAGRESGAGVWAVRSGWVAQAGQRRPRRGRPPFPDKKEKLIQEGKLDRAFNLLY
ncbi:PREDICTED: NADH dehydrogenase [ubiquinone] 1 beta subcomplex subunit 4 [Galeopterus variegatus]|uniref:NADH dehydrogenase [ubiquinone] 1 beta subcomplex subunit 4 n=1 Tax=Galeopterus variegatus TaxID=482537 RepID=A0ABM0RBU1_GALVR|nr:PREDICTED: NADH dehydrogenase [ubiquinone] 1 beta subcomplex subunit 4 [Galeopterus variegatus]